MVLNGVKSEYNRLPFFCTYTELCSGGFNRDTDECFNGRLVFNKFPLNPNNILSNIQTIYPISKSKSPLTTHYQQPIPYQDPVMWLKDMVMICNLDFCTHDFLDYKNISVLEMTENHTSLSLPKNCSLPQVVKLSETWRTTKLKFLKMFRNKPL